MVDGIYSITYRGRADWGTGMLLLQHGVITGADVAGSLYDGSYVEVGPNLQIDFVLTVPPGVTLVQGTSAQAKEYTIPAQATVPTRALDTSEPVLIDLPPGPVNVIFRRLRTIGS
jgi:hypothetical protein